MAVGACVGAAVVGGAVGCEVVGAVVGERVGAAARARVANLYLKRIIGFWGCNILWNAR